MDSAASLKPDTPSVVDDLPRGCTFDPADWRILAQHYYPIANERDLESGPVSAKLLDERLVIYRSGSEIVVAQELCPHRGVPLSMGKQVSDGVVCPYHGLRFGADGKCVSIPSHPTGSIPSKLNLKTYPAVVKYGLIWTCLRPGTATGAFAETSICPMPHWDEEGYEQLVHPHYDVAGFAGRQVESFLDVAHIGFVHVDTFGDPDNVVIPPYPVEPNSTGFEVPYRSSLNNDPKEYAGESPDEFEWMRHYVVRLPFVVTLEIHFPGEKRYVMMNAASPVSAKQTRLFTPTTYNVETTATYDENVEFYRRICDEDREMVEAQAPESLPLDITLEAHIPADRSSIAYRNGLRKLGLSHFFVA